MLCLIRVYQLIHLKQAKLLIGLRHPHYHNFNSFLALQAITGDSFGILLPSAGHFIASQKRTHPLIGLPSATMPLSTWRNYWLQLLSYLFLIFLVRLYWILMPVMTVLELCYPNVTMMAESMLLHMLVDRLVNLNGTTASLAESCLPLWHSPIIFVSIYWGKNSFYALITTLSHGLPISRILKGN